MAVTNKTLKGRKESSSEKFRKRKLNFKEPKLDQCSFALWAVTYYHHTQNTRLYRLLWLLSPIGGKATYVVEMSE